MADPVVHITAGLPDSGTGNITTLGQTLLDGADIATGATTDAAVAAGAAGSLSAKLRSISRDLIANIVLAAGSAIIGKVGIDQTTDGTTNLVRLGAETAKVIGTVRTAAGGVAAGSGVDGWDLTEGAIADAAVAAGATGSISAKLRSISRDLVSNIVLATGANIVGLFKLSDGTNTAAVKAASTVPVTATDPALVTVLRPDSPGIIATGAAGTPSATVLTIQGIAGGTLQSVGGVTVTQAASSTITRPADTTAYASGDLVANSVTAGSVTNLQFTTLARVSGGSGVIIGAQIQKSTASATNAAFRLHLFNTAPTYTSAGDNSALSTVVVASAKGYLGYIDITAVVGFSDVCWGSGAPDNSRGGIPYVATAQIIYGLLEARGAYTPGNAEVFTITVDALQD